MLHIQFYVYLSLAVSFRTLIRVTLLGLETSQSLPNEHLLIVDTFLVPMMSATDTSDMPVDNQNKNLTNSL